MGDPIPHADNPVRQSLRELNVPHTSLPSITTWQEWKHLEGATAAPSTTSTKGEKDPQAEIKKTIFSIKLALDIYAGNTSKFQGKQERSGLTQDQRTDLVTQTQRILNTPQRLETFLYALATHDIGKNPEVRAAVGADADVDHDEVYRRLLSDPNLESAREQFIPTFKVLPESEREFLKNAATIKSNYPQILQAEAPAATMADLVTASPEIRDFKILESKFDIFGATGNIQQEFSLTATESGYRRQANLDKVLQDSNPDLTSEDRINAFFKQEIINFTGSFDETDAKRLYNIAHLSCRLRTESSDEFSRKL